MIGFHAHARGRRKWLSAASMLLMAVGAGLLAYPPMSNALAQLAQDAAIEASAQAVAALTDEKAERLWLEARRYNQELTGDPVRDPFVPGSGYMLPDGYEATLDASGNGVMATLSIPIIDLRMPVYHGTSEEALRKGAGHLEQTALPIGESGLRPVITGHRGLPQAELFTRLDELDYGDTFVLHVLNKKLAYRIIEIEVIAPDDMQSIAAVPGKDLVTLATCTPYGVNTHRLLITGERCPLESAETRTPPDAHAKLFAAIMLAGATVLTVRTMQRRRKTMSVSKGRSQRRGMGPGAIALAIIVFGALALAPLCHIAAWASSNPSTDAAEQEFSNSEASVQEDCQAEANPSKPSDADEASAEPADGPLASRTSKSRAPSSAILSPSTDVTAPPLPAAGNEQSVSIAWRDTGDDMMEIGDDGSLSIDITGYRSTFASDLVVGATVEWTSSGSTDYEPGEVEVRIPDHLFMARDGEPYETVYELVGSVPTPHLKAGLKVELGVPEAPQQSADGWQYRHDEDAHEIVIVNADRIASGTKLVCEVNYIYSASWHETFGCERDGLLHPVYTELTSDPVRLYAEAQEAGRSQTGPATIATHNALESMEVEVAGIYDSWQPSWGETPEAGANALYVAWKATATFDHLYQPFSLELAPTGQDQGEIIGMTDAWMLGSPDDSRGDFDPDTCTFEAPAEADLSLGHLDVYAAARQDLNFNVEGLTASFAALVRYDKAALDSAEGGTELAFPARATLESLDHRDIQTAEGTHSFTYQPLGFDAPPGNRFDLRMNQGAPKLADSNAYYYPQGQVERLESGLRSATALDTSSAYASCFGETLGEGLDPSKAESYGKRPYTVEIIDDFAFIDGRLDAGEHEMTHVLDINAAAVTLYEGVPDYESGGYTIEPIEGAINPLEVTISTRTGDDGAWTPAARWTQTTSGRLDPAGIEPLAEGVEIRAFDPSDTLDSWYDRDLLSEYDGERRYDLALPPGTTGVKLSFETRAWAASVGDLGPGHSDPQFGLTIASEVLPSERIRELAAQSDTLYLYRANTLAAYDDAGTLLGFEGEPKGVSKDSPQAKALGERDRAFYGALMYHDTARADFVRADPSGWMSAYALDQKNDTVGKKVDFGTVRAEVSFTTRTREDDSNGLPASVQPPETSGTFYLLLPAGFAADTSTLRAAERLSGGQVYCDPWKLPIDGGAVVDRRPVSYVDEEGIRHNSDEYSPLAEVTSVDSFPNWRDSGRELLKVSVEASPGSKGYSSPHGPGGFDTYVSGFLLSFGGYYSWDSMADYGSSPRFCFAYESGNEDMGAWNGKPNSTPDDIGSGWTDEERRLLSGLDGDASSQHRWLYAQRTPTISFPTSAEYGLQLSAKAAEDTAWVSAGETTEEVQVYVGFPYAYRIRTALEEGSTATDNVIFDAIECYAPEGDQAGWRGTLEYIDTSALVSRGIDPVVYYSTTSGIDMEDSASRDLSNTALWSTDQPNSLGDVTAVAIDCSQAQGGGPYELQGGESLVAILGMRAPSGDGSSAPQSATYNQAWLASTVTSATGASSKKVLHHEATVVRIESMSLTLLKADAEGIQEEATTGTATTDGAHLLNGARFELYRYDGEGMPDDTPVGQNEMEGWTRIGAATSDPYIEFVGLAPDTYRLVETQAPLGYRLPDGQWSITLDPLLPHQAYVEAVRGSQGGEPPAFAITKGDEWIVPNVAQPSLPITGAAGIAGLMGLGATVLLTGVFIHASQKDRSGFMKHAGVSRWQKRARS